MKKILALVLALCMLFLVVACTKDETPEPTSAPEQKATETTDSTNDATDDTQEAADSGMVSDEPVTFTVFIDHSWYPVDSFTGIIPQEITALTNVTLDPTIAIDNKQLGIMAASGELPDLVYTQTMVDRMSSPDLAYSYEDLIAEYNVNWDLSPKQIGIARGLSEDGKAYTILNHYSEKKDWADVTGAAPMVGSMAVRQDLLEALGNPSVTSFDELFTVLGMVKDTYPDVVPLRLDQNWNTITIRFLWGMSQLDWMEQGDGSYIHYTKDSRYLDMLKWLNSAYREGYIIPDDPYFVKGSTAIATDKWFASSSCTQNGITGTNADLAAIDPSYKVFELTPFEQSSYLTSDTGWSGTFITIDNSNPEVAIKFMAWMFSPEAQALTQMGREGIDYTLGANGLPEFSAEWKQSIEDGNQETVFNTWFYFGGSEIVEAVSRCATTDPALVKDAYDVIRERFDNMPWIKAAEPVGDSDEKVILDKIKEIVINYEAKMILAESAEEVDALYQEYLGIIDQTGVATVEEYITNKIAEIKPLYE